MASRSGSAAGLVLLPCAAQVSWPPLRLHPGRVFFASLVFLSLASTSPLSFVDRQIDNLSRSIKMDCNQLKALFPTQTFLPGTTQYLNSTQSYFAAFENELKPACVLEPKTAQDVANIVRYVLISSPSSKVAVRGGGHTPWAGAANIEGPGVTIDLRQLSGVAVSASGVVQIGAGTRWANVYSTLEEKGLAVVGGRVSKVGVTGLTIGGGLSYFSATTGFVCDNVVNFEVVLSSGEIVQANKASHADLFRALKGGTNNFGIVTRIDLPAFQQGMMWGGAAYYLPATYPDIIKALSDFAQTPTPDGNAHVIVATAFSPAGAVNVVNVYHTTPDSNPPSLAPFVTIPAPLMSTLRQDSLLGFANEQSAFSTDGARQQFFTTTIKVDQQLLLDLKPLFDAAVASIKTVPGLTLSMVFQPVTKQLLQSSASHGPNALGLTPADGPFVICLLNSVHDNAADDPAVVAAVTKLQSQIESLANSRGLGVRYRFLNYSYKTSNPIESYGQENIEFLRAVAARYDPTHFFKDKVPGGFKLP